MAIIGALPNTISNGQAIDAVPVMADFNWIVTQTNANAAAIAATNVFTAVQKGVAANDPAAFPTASQVQTSAFNWCGVAGGTANALTLTPSPAITSYTPGSIFTFQAGATPNSGATTVAISGLTTLAVQVGGAACVGGEIAANKWYYLLVDASGTTVQLISLSISIPLSAAQGGTGTITGVGTVVGAYRNWVATSVGVNNLNCVVSADEIVLENSANLYYTARAVSLTINANGSVGAPLSIMQARAASTFYYIWVWRNASLGVTATLDNSSSSPTAPTGYVSGDYKARMPGPQLTDGSGTKYLMQQKTVGKYTEYIPLSGSNVATYLQIASGSGVGSISVPTWVAIGLTSYVPPTALAGGRVVGTLMQGTASNAAMVAPNNQYGPYNSNTNQPPCVSVLTVTNVGLTMPFNFIIESNNIYWANNGQSYVYLMGYEENI
jgi:hypothetical protein